MARQYRKLIVPGAVSTSFVLHVGLIGTGAWLVASLGARDDASSEALPQASATQLELEAPEVIELPTIGASGERSARADPEVKPEPPAVPGGGSEMPRPDQRRAGRGGSDQSREQAQNLSDSMDDISLTPSPLNNFERSQIQRLKTSKRRQSRDDRRATPNPMQLSFLATGTGTRQERRRWARWDPSRGTAAHWRAQTAGGLIGADLELGQGDLPRAGTERVGNGERDLSGAGVVDGQPGQAYRRSANVALARPAIRRSRAAVPAQRKARPHDNTESSQEVANAVRSLIHASTAGGPQGVGPGGQSGPGHVGSGGEQGPGSRSRAAGRGGGLQRSAADPGLTAYFRNLEQAVDWDGAFPLWAIRKGRSGVAIVSFTLDRQGRVSQMVLTRRSGVPEFDKNVILAIRKAAPFGPLPRAAGGAVRVNMTFDALNPIVGPPSY